jgi:hypothetical protein
MAILSWRELPRTFERRFGERFAAERRFVFTLDDDGTTLQTAADAASVGTLGHQHPEFSILATNFEYEESFEGSRYHALLKVSYGGDVQSDPDEFLSPTTRPAKWSFQTQGTTVPALFYYDEPGNDSVKPLTNSAFDYFSGVQTDEAQVKIIIQENRTNFPIATAVDLTNTINADTWLGAAPGRWKCQGINGELRFEIFNENRVRYWAITVELLYRQTGWPLQLPDVGLNFLFGSPPTQKRRAVVFDFENSEWVAAPNPVGLDGTGGLTLGAPAILERRVHREVNFNAFFANPPS